MFNEMNFKSTVRTGVDTDSMDFIALKELCGQTIKVDGFFFTDSGDYGKQVVVVGNGYKINMPNRCVKDFEKIEQNSKMLKALLEGHLMITNVRMKDTKNGTTAIFDYVDC